MSQIQRIDLWLPEAGGERVKWVKVKKQTPVIK